MWHMPESNPTDLCECSWLDWNEATDGPYIRSTKGEHDRAKHRDGTGRCRARDSYGTPCQCRSFKLDPNPIPRSVHFCAEE